MLYFLRRENVCSILMRVLLEMGLNFLELREGKQAAQVFERCLKEFPQSAKRPDVMLNVANAYLLNGQTAKARKSLSILIEDFPQSDAARTAKTLLKSL